MTKEISNPKSRIMARKWSLMKFHDLGLKKSLSEKISLRQEIFRWTAGKNFIENGSWPFCGKKPLVVVMQNVGKRNILKRSDRVVWFCGVDISQCIFQKTKVEWRRTRRNFSFVPISFRAHLTKWRAIEAAISEKTPQKGTGLGWFQNFQKIWV